MNSALSRRLLAVSCLLAISGAALASGQVVHAGSGKAVAAKKCKKKRHKRKCKKGTGTTVVAPPVTTAPTTTTTTTPPPQYTLDVATAGIGTGTVTSTPVGIDCPSDCTETYPQGQSVTLNGVPGTNTAFSGWSGDCTGISFCGLTMDGAKSVTATFDPGYALNLTIQGSSEDGTVTSTPEGIDCTKSSGSVSGTCWWTFATGTSVTLTPQPATTLNRVWSWGGDCSGLSTTNPCTVDMTQTRNVTVSMFET